MKFKVTRKNWKWAWIFAAIALVIEILNRNCFNWFQSSEGLNSFFCSSPLWGIWADLYDFFLFNLPVTNYDFLYSVYDGGLLHMLLFGGIGFILPFFIKKIEIK